MKSPGAKLPLDGCSAYVPGGYGAIGAAVAHGLAAAGARVAVSGRSAEKAEALAAELREGGCDAFGLAMDAHRVADIRASVDAVAQRFGGLDVLVNCVGIQREERLDDVTEEAFDEVLQVNLKAAMFLGQAAARHQVAAALACAGASADASASADAGGNAGSIAGAHAGAVSRGRQVHILSVRAQLGLRDRGYSAYCASKGSLVMLVKQHAMELARHGITVNGVAPTVVRGEMARHWLDNPVTHQQVLERIPLGRVAEPEDVAGATLFFCSPAAAFVTGQVLYVDGGITASQ